MCLFTFCFVTKSVYNIINMVDSEVSSKKSKKSKSTKKTKSFADITKKEDNSSAVRKQHELMRVLHVKNFQLQNGNLSYLDYIELKEELFRLNALKDMFNTME